MKQLEEWVPEEGDDGEGGIEDGGVGGVVGGGGRSALLCSALLCSVYAKIKR